jgi:hypothetical protein
VTSLAFSDFCCTVAYGITNLYTKSMSLYRFFILCILYLLFAWFHVSNDKGTFPLCVDIFFSHRPAFYRTSLYIRVTPLGFWWSSCCSSLVFLSSCCVFCVECCQCLCIVHSWLSNTVRDSATKVWKCQRGHQEAESDPTNRAITIYVGDFIDDRPYVDR